MSDHDATRRVLRVHAEEALIKLALHMGADAERVVQGFNDLLTLEDRIEFVDAEVWWAEEIQPVEPEVGHINGLETGLFYRGAVNTVYGTDNCGKTLLLQHILMQELMAGNEVMYLDAEEGSPRNMFLRLQSMGSDPSLGKRFHYANVNKAPSAENRAMFIEISKRCSLVVIDSAGEFMGMYGKDQVKDLETRSILFEMYGRPLVANGAAAVILDHISKSSDGSQATGSIRKRAAIDGAAYYLVVDEGQEWSKTKTGEGRLVCQKDRNGTYHRGQLVASMYVSPAAKSADGLLIVELSEYVELDDVIEENTPPVSKPLRDIDALIIEIVQGSTTPVWESYIVTMLKNNGIEMTKTKAKEACARLIQDGWLQRDPAGYRSAPLHSV